MLINDFLFLTTFIELSNVTSDLSNDNKLKDDLNGDKLC